MLFSVSRSLGRAETPQLTCLEDFIQAVQCLEMPICVCGGGGGRKNVNITMMIFFFSSEIMLRNKGQRGWWLTILPSCQACPPWSCCAGLRCVMRRRDRQMHVKIDRAGITVTGGATYVQSPPPPNSLNVIKICRLILACCSIAVINSKNSLQRLN